MVDGGHCQFYGTIYIVVAVSRTECERAQHCNGSILNMK